MVNDKSSPYDLEQDKDAYPNAPEHYTRSSSQALDKK